MMILKLKNMPAILQQIGEKACEDFASTWSKGRGENSQSEKRRKSALKYHQWTATCMLNTGYYTTLSVAEGCCSIRQRGRKKAWNEELKSFNLTYWRGTPILPPPVPGPKH
ncbi:hypothetical protein H8959_014877 [Pygathrix nigripes]